QLGYDLIKFHEFFLGTTTGLSRPAYRRMVEAARRIGIPLIGHAPVNLGMDEMLRARQSIAHVGMLDNVYFLPFSSHTTILFISAVATLILICLALTSRVAAVIRRSTVEGRSKLTRSIIAVSTAGALACAFAFLPGSPLFNSAFLRMAFSLLAGIVAT